MQVALDKTNFTFFNTCDFTNCSCSSNDGLLCKWCKDHEFDCHILIKIISLWIKVFAKCVNVNKGVYNPNT